MAFKNPEDAVRHIIKNFPSRPYDKPALDALVSKTLKETPSNRPADIRKAQWEFAVKNEIFELAMNEGKALEDPETSYFDDLKDRLSLVLTLTEHDACEQTFPFNTLQDLLETQTISSCSHVFSWIESNADRLTDGMVPAKGKTLIILRMLNDLLRRLSKMGSNSIFCGRILTFLSGVFPLGERSGVNLRGEYGPIWDTVEIKSKGEEDMDEDTKVAEVKVEEKEIEKDIAEKTEVVQKKTTADKKQEQKDDFYNTFWSLQLPFSRPPLFASPETFPRFREAVNKVLPIINEATAKERALMGSRSTYAPQSLKRKREAEPGEESPTTEYFFAKFLTSPELLDLEIADTHFRRQFLFQLLILLNHLLLFTKSSRAVWTTTRNRSLQFDFTLEPPELQWVLDTTSKVQEELRQTAPGGRPFADSVSTILEREKNWVKWKNDLCAPFDREPYSVDVDGRRVGLWEETEEVRKKMRQEPEPWPYSHGTQALSEIWDLGYRDLRDLENPFQPGEVKDFVKKVQLEENRIQMRKKQLARTAERIAQARAKAAAAAAPPAPTSATPSTAPVPQTESNASLAAPAASPPRPPAAISGAASPLHPSLPAKPGSKPASKSADTVSIAPSSSPAPPATSSAPSPATAAAAASTAVTATAASRVGTPAGAPPTATQTPAAGPPPPPAMPKIPKDTQIEMFEEIKQRHTWLGLRMARDHYLNYFGRIGGGDVVLLAAEVERDANAQKEAQEKALAAGVVHNNANDKAEHTVTIDGPRDSPAVSSVDQADVASKENGNGDMSVTEDGMVEKAKVEPAKVDVEGDVKMET